MDAPNIRLQKLSIEDGPLVYRMLQRIPRKENGFINNANGLPYVKYKEWLKYHVGMSTGKNLKPGMVAQTTYWLYVDDIPVGFGKLRHSLNQSLRQNGGNISYAIDPKYRGKGYGSLLLQYILVEANLRGMQEILLTAYAYNQKSIAVAKSNGGIVYRITSSKYYFRFEPKKIEEKEE